MKKYLYLENVNLGDKGVELLVDEFKERLKGLTNLYLESCSIKEDPDSKTMGLDAKIQSNEKATRLRHG